MRRVHTFLAKLIVIGFTSALQIPLHAHINWAKHPPFHRISSGRGNDGSDLFAMGINATKSDMVVQESIAPHLKNDYYDDYTNDDEDTEMKEGRSVHLGLAITSPLSQSLLSVKVYPQNDYSKFGGFLSASKFVVLLLH